METKPKRSSRLTPPVAAEVPAVTPAPMEPLQAAAEPMPAPEPPQAAAEPIPALPPAAVAPAPAALPPPAVRDPLAALIESQAAVARGLGEFGSELAALAQGGIDAATRSASDLLTAKSFADAARINASFARHSFDAWIGGAARLSEIGVKLAAEASRPILAQLNRDWARATR